MSRERKTLLLAQQQARRAEAAKIRLLQEANEADDTSELKSQCTPPRPCLASTGHVCTPAATRALAEVANTRGTIEDSSRVNVTSPTVLPVNDLAESFSGTLTELVNTVEQQHSRWNLLRCTRYAEMPTNRKTIMLAHQQAQRAQAKKVQLSQQVNDIGHAPEVTTQSCHPNIAQTSAPSLTTSEGDASRRGGTTTATEVG